MYYSRDLNNTKQYTLDVTCTEHIETIPVTVILGDLYPTAAANYVLIDIQKGFDSNATMSGTTISCSYPLFVHGNNRTVYDLHNALGSVGMSLHSSEIEPYWLGIALQIKDKYSSTDDISAELKAKQGVNLSTIDSVTVYGLWKETVSAVFFVKERVKPVTPSYVIPKTGDNNNK